MSMLKVKSKTGRHKTEGAGRVGQRPFQSPAVDSENAASRSAPRQVTGYPLVTPRGVLIDRYLWGNGPVRKAQVTGKHIIDRIHAEHWPRVVARVDLQIGGYDII